MGELAMETAGLLDTLKPQQNACHLVNNIFKCIIYKENDYGYC